MAEAHKFKSLDDAEAAFPGLPWKARGDGAVFIFDAKRDEYVQVSEGQFIVSIGDRFEISDSEPEKAKPAAEKPKAKAHESNVEGADSPLTDN